MKPRLFSRIAARSVAGGLLLLMMIAASGCTLVGVIADKAIGPTEEPAQYTPPKEPMLVMVENHSRAESLQSSSDQLALLIRNELTEHKVAPLVDQDKLYALRGANPAKFGSMAISDVGRAVGAKQVLYVSLDECAVASMTGSDVYQGKVGGTVKIIDVASGETRWPQLASGYPFHAEDAMARNTDSVSHAEVRDRMLQDTAEAIGRFFYNYKPDYDNAPDTQD